MMHPLRCIRVWIHNSGFSVHNKMRIKPRDDKELENLFHNPQQYLFTFQHSKDTKKILRDQFVKDTIIVITITQPSFRA